MRSNLTTGKNPGFVSEGTRRAVWVTLYLQLPGVASRPAGILLWDSSGDKLFVAVRDLVPIEMNGDVEVFWLEFPEWLSSLAEELGGLEALELLESSSSHTVQIGARNDIALGKPKDVLHFLFETEILDVVSKPRFSERDLAKAEARLPLLPSSAVQIVAALNNPLIDSREVERSIARDPVLTAHMIRIANSADLPTREPARTLGSAIQRIGFEATKLHTLALTVGKMYSSAQLRKVWDHSVQAAQIARQVAAKAGYSAEEAALLSLVHDIGVIVIFALGTSIQAEYAEMQASGLTNISIEKKLCRVSHAEIGANLLSAWRFPKDMCEAVRHHHSPSQTQTPFASILYLTESWLETNEDVYDCAEHTNALKTLNLESASFGALRSSLDIDLQVIRAVASR